MYADIHTLTAERNSMSDPRPVRSYDYPFADTDAARILKSVLDGRKAHGVSLRSLAKDMGYSPAVLSHMANGRIGVPLEKATHIARTLRINERDFLAAVVAQRAPEALGLLGPSLASDFELVAEIKVITGLDPDQLSDEQKSVIREIAADPHPRRRWLSVAELPAVALLRQWKPTFSDAGLSRLELNFIQAGLERGP